MTIHIAIAPSSHAFARTVPAVEDLQLDTAELLILGKECEYT